MSFLMHCFQPLMGGFVSLLRFVTAVSDEMLVRRSWLLITACAVGVFPLGMLRPALADVVAVGGITAGELGDESQGSESSLALANAIEAFKKNDLAQCKVELLKAKEADGDLPRVDVILSRMHLSRGSHGVVLSLLEKVAAEFPSDPDVYQCFGELALATGRHTDAWLHFEKANALVEAANLSKLSEKRKKSLSLQITRLRAITAEKREDYRSAAIFYRELIARLPDEKRLNWKLGQVLVAEGDAQGGFEILQREHLSDPSLPQPELTVATILVTQDQHELAEIWYRNGVRADSAGTQNFLEYARWLLQRDRLEFAKELLSKIPLKWKSNRDVVFIRAVVDRCLDNLDDAESGLKKILRDNSDDLESLDQLVLIWVESAKKEDQDQAKQVSQSNLGRTPKLQRSIATAAWVEWKLGSTDVAEKMFTVLNQSGTITPQTAYYIGQFLESKGQVQEAGDFYRRALTSRGFFAQRRMLKEKLAVSTEP